MSGWQLVLMNLQILARRKSDSCQKQLVIMNERENFLICCKYRTIKGGIASQCHVCKEGFRAYGFKPPIFKSDS